MSHVRVSGNSDKRLHIYSGLVKSVLFFGAQLCALCDPMDCCLPGSSVCGIFQVRTGAGCHFLYRGSF